MASGGTRSPEESEKERKPAPVTPEPVWVSRKRHPKKARPKEDEVSRGQPERRSREREHPVEHALLEVVGFSTHADTGEAVGGRCGSASVRVRVGGGRRGSVEKSERAALESLGSSPASSAWFWRDVVGLGCRQEFQCPGLSEC